MIQGARRTSRVTSRTNFVDRHGIPVALMFDRAARDGSRVGVLLRTRRRGWRQVPSRPSESPRDQSESAAEMTTSLEQSAELLMEKIVDPDIQIDEQ